jgi:hypothetical protein
MVLFVVIDALAVACPKGNKRLADIAIPVLIAVESAVAIG